MTREELKKALTGYKTPFVDEEIFIPRFLNLLEHPRAYHRDHLPGHMTGSAWIVDETAGFVLLTHHAKLNRWLQPGGHADGEENIFEVALKEAREETGLVDFGVISTDLFDIDIHEIPERNGFPAHDHYDIRILLSAKRNTSLVITEESHALEWVNIHDLAARTGNNQSMLRMAEKSRFLFAAEKQ